MNAVSGWTAPQVGYCSNVHPTRDLAGLRASIARHFQGVRRLRGLDEQDSGLWICARAAAELQQASARESFLQLLQHSGLRLTSLNGFPYGEFHQGAVKAEVYLPDWADPQRLAYSLDLARILAQALPADCAQGVISTVPWATPPLGPQHGRHAPMRTSANSPAHSPRCIGKPARKSCSAWKWNRTACWKTPRRPSPSSSNGKPSTHTMSTWRCVLMYATRP